MTYEHAADTACRSVLRRNLPILRDQSLQGRVNIRAMLTEQKIHGFIVLATELNYTKAAERLHITQQTLSKQISSMETDIGGKLFERTTKKVALTELGTKLFAWFSRAEREHQALIKEYVDQAHKHIDICCFEDMDIGTEIGEARKRLTEENPDLNIKYSFAYEHSFGTIVKGLDRGIFNLAIVPNGSIFSASKFRTVTLHENDFVVYFSPTLCDLPHPTLYDLRNYKFLIGADSDNAISMVQDICRASGFEPILDMSPERSPSVERMMIESGEGIGFGGERSILNRFQSLRSISTNTTAKIIAVWRRSEQNSVIPSFVDTLKKVLNNA